MGHIRETVHIKASVEQVWDFIIDYKRWPEWQVNLVDIGDFEGIPGEPGFSYSVTYKALGRKIEGTFKVVKSDRPGYLEEKGHMPGTGEATSVTMLESAPGGGTRCTFTLDYEMGAGFLGGFADRFILERSIERDFHHSGENLKELVEARVGVLTG